VVERIAGIVGSGAVPTGEVHIGDDAAVLAPLVGQAVVSTDTAVAGVHLDLDLFPTEDLGYKAVASAVSDLAAMGARPRALVVAVTAPVGADLDALHEGIGQAARALHIPVVGGDLTHGKELVVTVTVLGECPGAGAVLRSGAKDGDTLFVTRPLGRAAAGLRQRRDGAPLDDELVTAQRRPWPRLGEGLAARGATVHAMMDLSDGLGADLHRLADASKVGFVLTSVPVAPGATLDEALNGGEDYELLIATDDPARLSRVFAERGLLPPLAIGHVVARPDERTWKDEPFERSGFQHRF
jgi:thiamine-monophosphate kinase